MSSYEQTYVLRFSFTTFFRFPHDDSSATPQDGRFTNDEIYWLKTKKQVHNVTVEKERKEG